MKQIISALFLCMLLSGVPRLQAQNIQLHYDFGRSLYDKDLQGRPLFTSTVEKFHPDTWGSTYFFVDMDYTSEGVASAYWEIAREIKFWKGPFSAHLEYNGGLSKGMSYKNAYLAGATYTFNNASFSKGFTLTAMYKYIQKHQSPNNFQLTVRVREFLPQSAHFLRLCRLVARRNQLWKDYLSLRTTILGKPKQNQRSK